MRVRYTPRAIGDLAAILRYLSESDEAWIVHIRDGRRKPWRGE
jgi:hypothetical protein